MKQTLHIVENQERGFQESTDILSHLSSAPHTDRDRTEVEPGGRRSQVTWRLFSGEAGRGPKEVEKKRAHRSWGHTGHCIVCTTWGEERESCSLGLCYCHSQLAPSAPGSSPEETPTAPSVSFAGPSCIFWGVLKANGSFRKYEKMPLSSGHQD